MTDPPLNDDRDPLASLPAHDVAAGRAEQIRRRAHLALREGQRHGAQRPIRAWQRTYHQLVEPAVLIALGLWQLAWTVQDTLALFH